MNSNLSLPKNKEHYKWLFLFCDETIDRIKKQGIFKKNDTILDSLSYSLFSELKNDASSILDAELTQEVCIKNGIIKELVFLVGKEETEKTSFELLSKLNIKGKEYFDDRYPLFKEMIERDCDIFFKNVMTVYKRIMENKTSIEDCILGHKVNEIVDIKLGLGDLHNNHQSTAIIYFDNGKLVYHPRDCRIDKWYEDLIKSSFSDITYAPKTLCIDDLYGFSEYIDSRPAQNDSNAQKYFFNFGGLCAILKMLGSNDIHYENVLAKDEIYPSLIDLEMIISGERKYPFGAPEQSFNRDLQDTVITKCILPSYDREHNFQASPLANTSSDNGSLPIINGKKIDVYPYEECFINGFSDIYNRCIDLKDSLLSSIEQINNARIRWIIRPTQAYYSMKRTLLMPEFFTSNEKRKEYITKNINHFSSIISGPLSEIIINEFNALSNGDIPFFYSDGNLKDLIANDEKIVSDFFNKSPVEHAKDIILSLGKEGLRFELDIIRHSFKSAIIIDDEIKIDQSITDCDYTNKETIQSLLKETYEDVRNDCLLSNNGIIGWLMPDYSGNLQIENIFIESGISGLALFFASVANTIDNSIIKNEAIDLCKKCLEKIDIYLNDYIEKDSISSALVGLGMIKGMAGVIYSIDKCCGLIGINKANLLLKAIDAANKVLIEEINDCSYESGLLGIAYAINHLKDMDYCGLSILKDRVSDQLLKLCRKQTSANIEQLASLKLLNLDCENISLDTSSINKESLMDKIRICCITKNHQELDRIIDLDVFYGDRLEFGNAMCIDLLLNIGNATKAKYILSNVIHRKRINGHYLFGMKGEKLTTNSSMMFGLSGIGYELARFINGDIKGLYFGELERHVISADTKRQI